MSEPKLNVPDNYWPCACVKRDANGNLTKIKCHAPTQERCRVCKCNRPPNYDPLPTNHQLRRKDGE